MLTEAKRLYHLGYGIHWLKPKSKAPVKGGWSGPVRDDWETLEREHRKEYGLGVRLGEPSKVGDGYLAVIDVDLKSSSDHHKHEAFAVVNSHFPGLMDTAPIVQTGRGYHIYVRTKTPQKSGKIKTSAETVKVFSPTSEVNKRQSELLTADEIKKGLRVKNAWEVDFMSTGKQVVLPPTIHPDTGRSYKWINRDADIPFIHFEVGKGKEPPSDTGYSKEPKVKFKAVAFDLIGSKLSDRIIDMILTGDRVEDRSAACFSVAIAMLKCGYSDMEIMSVLTDRTTFLGETAFDHRKTNDRANAAAWIEEHSIRKAREMLRADRAFEDEVGVTPMLESDEAVTAQLVELTYMAEWQMLLDRTKGGKPQATLENLVLVLRNAVGETVFKRDLFALRDFYGMDTPWGGKTGGSLTDDDAILIKLWVGENYRFEPSLGTVFEAMTAIAIGNAYHPIRDRYAALPAWDCVPRLDTWLARNFEAKAPPEYLAQVFRKWMVASVARIYRPGLKFDWMIIFEGAQGIGKSSFGRLLFGDNYFTDWLPDLGDKDSALALQGLQCVEFGELANLRKAELETAKAFVARTVDKVRPPYGRKTIESPRQCVFFGTTNRDEYLKDDTGNRRFNPVVVGQLNFEALARDREQLFAEALFLYHNGFDTWLDLEGEAEVVALQIRKDKMVQDESNMMLEEIQANEKNPDSLKHKLPKEGLILSELFSEQGVLNSWKKDNRNMMFAAKALIVLGYEKKTLHEGNRWRLKIG